MAPPGARQRRAQPLHVEGVGTGRRPTADPHGPRRRHRPGSLETGTKRNPVVVGSSPTRPITPPIHPQGSVHGRLGACASGRCRLWIESRRDLVAQPYLPIV